MPAAMVMSYAPSASAATVLAVEGTLQPSRTTQKAFSGAFCAQNTCRSINNARTPFDVRPGSRQLQAAIDSTPGDVILMGFSLGAASIYDRMREWEESPELAPDPQRVRLIVTFGNPENKYGGEDRNNSYAGLPQFQPYQHLDVTMQYDSVADRATRWGWYSAINTAFSRHFDYFTPTDINDPDNLIHRDADGTTYMLIKADVLPMLKWMDWFTPDERMAELDAKYRPLVEQDYDRPEYVEQGAGADWGNGNPPPAIAADDLQKVPDEIPSEEPALAAESSPLERSAPTRRLAAEEQQEDDDDPEADLPVPADTLGDRDDPERPDRAKSAVDSDDDESDDAGKAADDESGDDGAASDAA
ncbi:PE-PPE domain-containing protein [Mycolicibacterium hippocampi]|nr:PE-PPE domain-containing protein [Mycolicibacterium hippocampi]